MLDREREIAEWARSLMKKRMAPFGAFEVTARRYGVEPDYVRECFKKLEDEDARR